VARDIGERGGACGVVGAKKGVRGKAGGDGGGTLLKGHGGRAAEGGPRGEGATRRREDVGPRPDRRVAPERPWPGSGARGRCGAVRTGEHRPLTCGPWPAAGVRGSGEAWGRVGRPGKKMSGPSLDEQETFQFIQLNFN
jgi:hypothetical protein